MLDIGPGTEIAGRPVVMLDDVLDTGITAAFVEKHLYKRGATQVDLTVLVQKTKQRLSWQNATRFGFLAPDVWLTNSGMDDARIRKEANRWMAGIAIGNDVEAEAQDDEPRSLLAAILRGVRRRKAA